MKKLYLFCFVLIVVVSSCSDISNKSVSEKLSTEELSKVIKSDTLFAEIYEHVRKEVDEFSDIKKATYNDVTYRRLFNYIKFLQDTTYWSPYRKKWNNEWRKENEVYLLKADSVLDYWKNYLEENSLDKYVKIELVAIDKEYYTYSNELKNVSLGFELTPLKGTIEQLSFNYRYKSKINSEINYYGRDGYVSFSPFSSPIIGYSEVMFVDKKAFADKNVETFLRDYNLFFEVTNICIDGVNISSNDFKVPEYLSAYFENDGYNDDMREYYKGLIIKEMMNKNFLSIWKYQEIKADVLRKKKDKLCYDFLQEL